MKWQTLIVDVFERVSQVLGQALDGLSLEDLNYQPSPDSNSIGWLVWHLTRCQDLAFAAIMGEEQVWVKGEWHVRFNRPADPKNFGLGHNPDDLAAFKSPDAGTLVEYFQAVYERTKQYLTDVSEADLARKFDHPVFPTVEARLVAIINDNLQHTGQVAYLRGLREGKGWQKV